MYDLYVPEQLYKKKIKELKAQTQKIFLPPLIRCQCQDAGCH